MCFSATASFVAAGETAACGIATLVLVRSSREIPLAAVPLLFGVQQAIEGVLWLLLPRAANSFYVRPLALSFVIIAEVLWPALVPLAVLLIEPGRLRRRILAGACVAGILVAGTSLLGVIENPQGACILAGSIRYGNDAPYYSWWPMLYGLATVVSPLISSHRPVRWFGALILIGYAVSAYAYERTLTSVWCFFAAASSLALLFYFVRRGGHGVGMARDATAPRMASGP